MRGTQALLHAGASGKGPAARNSAAAGHKASCHKGVDRSTAGNFFDEHPPSAYIPAAALCFALAVYSGRAKPYREHPPPAAPPLQQAEPSVGD